MLNEEKGTGPTPWTKKRRPVSVDTDPGGSAGHVRAVSVAVEWIWIRHGYVRTSVCVSGKVHSADDFRCRERAWLDDVSIIRRVGGGSTRTTEVCVQVVSAGIDDGN